ncbi:MAG: YceD family protein [Croceibacterium sp.]
MSEPAPPWSVPVRLSDISETGRRVTLEADAVTRAALAEALGVDSVQRASATFDLSHWGRDGLHVAGRVSATVGQSCVVTLEPVVSEINEDVDVDFAPEPAAVARPKSEEEAPSSIEGPDPLVGDSIDVGALATEYLILGVDPHPRKPGIAFDAPKAEDAAEGSPFAALAALKKGTVKE